MAAGGFAISVEVEDVEAQVQIAVRWADKPTTEQITTLVTEAYAAAVKRVFVERQPEPEVFKSSLIDPKELR